MSGPLQDAPRSSRIIRPRASVMECARPSAALASVAPGILDRSNRPCHLWARCGHWWESAKCLAHSKTLRAVRESSVHAPASWSAAALRRFGIGGTRHFRSQQPALPLVGAVRPLMGKRQRAGPLQDAPQSSRIIRPRASVMECARPSAALASVARGILDRSNRPCHCGRGAATDGKAPEGWRTPRRSAQFENHPFARQRHGVRAALRRSGIGGTGILDRSNRPCHCGRGAATDGKAPEGWRTPRRLLSDFGDSVFGFNDTGKQRLHRAANLEHCQTRLHLVGLIQAQRAGADARRRFALQFQRKLPLQR